MKTFDCFSKHCIRTSLILFPSTAVFNFHCITQIGLPLRYSTPYAFPLLRHCQRTIGSLWLQGTSELPNRFHGCARALISLLLARHKSGHSPIGRSRTSMPSIILPETWRRDNASCSLCLRRSIIATFLTYPRHLQRRGPKTRSSSEERQLIPAQES